MSLSKTVANPMPTVGKILIVVSPTTYSFGVLSLVDSVKIGCSILATSSLNAVSVNSSVLKKVCCGCRTGTMCVASFLD